mgnify:CR=1 FL=1
MYDFLSDKGIMGSSNSGRWIHHGKEEAGGVRIHVTESTPMGLLTKVPRWSPMLKDATCLKNVYIVCGFTDLRKGIDSLAAIIADRTGRFPLRIPAGRSRSFE